MIAYRRIHVKVSYLRNVKLSETMVEAATKMTTAKVANVVLHGKGQSVEVNFQPRRICIACIGEFVS